MNYNIQKFAFQIPFFNVKVQIQQSIKIRLGKNEKNQVLNFPFNQISHENTFSQIICKEMIGIRAGKIEQNIQIKPLVICVIATVLLAKIILLNKAYCSVFFIQKQTQVISKNSGLYYGLILKLNLAQISNQAYISFSIVQEYIFVILEKKLQFFQNSIKVFKLIINTDLILFIKLELFFSDSGKGIDCLILENLFIIILSKNLPPNLKELDIKDKTNELYFGWKNILKEIKDFAYPQDLQIFLEIQTVDKCFFNFLHNKIVLMKILSHIQQSLNYQKEKTERKKADNKSKPLVVDNRFFQKAGTLKQIVNFYTFKFKHILQMNSTKRSDNIQQINFQ
ncbi:unnamed protein product [Paramecium sonneborni]|uniref:Uncharacterized protein n=1 Tax=Paramecium sonneborni TaxID=65129 RepID=A0A8S1RR75_9CILI|nr:unnamed protein product [Paramecium sonneborni]